MGSIFYDGICPGSDDENDQERARGDRDGVRDPV